MRPARSTSETAVRIPRDGLGRRHRRDPPRDAEGGHGVERRGVRERRLEGEASRGSLRQRRRERVEARQSGRVEPRALLGRPRDHALVEGVEVHAEDDVGRRERLARDVLAGCARDDRLEERPDHGVPRRAPHRVDRRVHVGGPRPRRRRVGFCGCCFKLAAALGAALRRRRRSRRRRRRLLRRRVVLVEHDGALDRRARGGQVVDRAGAVEGELQEERALVAAQERAVLVERVEQRTHDGAALEQGRRALAPRTRPRVRDRRHLAVRVEVQQPPRLGVAERGHVGELVDPDLLRPPGVMLRKLADEPQHARRPELGDVVQMQHGRQPVRRRARAATRPHPRRS
mmetsp:Transcript_1366/g.5282  ORF Transcript_1366/g.5282 Transcript_1366/m.5282 type:complete len:344 (-) Transcript_1366:7-1038(-)